MTDEVVPVFEKRGTTVPRNRNLDRRIPLESADFAVMISGISDTRIGGAQVSARTVSALDGSTGSAIEGSAIESSAIEGSAIDGSAGSRPSTDPRQPRGASPCLEGRWGVWRYASRGARAESWHGVV